MTINTSTSFTETRDQIILDAFQLLGVYGLGRTVSSEDMNMAVNVLNKMVKAWGTKGLHLWCKEEAILYLTPNVSKYQFGTTATAAYATLASGSHMSRTTASAALGATTINVISTAGMTVADYVGVVQSDNTVFWTTIATIPSGTQLTLTLGTTQTVNNAGNIYSFTTLINKPYRILSCRRVWGFDAGATTSIDEVIMNPMSHSEYYDLPLKSANGLPNQFYYDPQDNYGELRLWQRPNDANYRIHFTYERIMADMLNPSDNFDLPQEWLEPLTWQLASRLGPAFGKGKKVREEIQPMAAIMLGELLDFDSEITSVSFQPDIEGK